MKPLLRFAFVVALTSACVGNGVTTMDGNTTGGTDLTTPPTGDTGETTPPKPDPFDDYADADLTNPDTVRVFSQASSPNVLLLSLSLVTIVTNAADSDGCPVVAKDKKAGIVTFTGGCEAGGLSVTGTMTLALDDVDNPTQQTVEFSKDFLIEQEQPCDATGSVTNRIGVSGTMIFQESGVFDVDIALLGSDIDTKACTSFPNDSLLDYQGTTSTGFEIGDGETETTTTTTSGPEKPAVYSGSGRYATTSIATGKVDAVTDNEQILGDTCNTEALSGTTTLTTDANEVVITYDGASDCDPESTVTWTLNGAAQGELEDVACSTGATPASFMMLLGTLFLLRRRRG